MTAIFASPFAGVHACVRTEISMFCISTHGTVNPRNERWDSQTDSDSATKFIYKFLRISFCEVRAEVQVDETLCCIYTHCVLHAATQGIR